MATTPQSPSANKLNTVTIAAIERGFQHIQGRPMQDSDFAAMSLGDAKVYLATAKNLASAQKAGHNADDHTFSDIKQISARSSAKKWIIFGVVVLVIAAAIAMLAMYVDLSKLTAGISWLDSVPDQQ